MKKSLRLLNREIAKWQLLYDEILVLELRTGLKFEYKKTVWREIKELQIEKNAIKKMHQERVSVEC